MRGDGKIDYDAVLASLGPAEKAEFLVRLLEDLDWRPDNFIPLEVHTALAGAITLSTVDLVLMRFRPGSGPWEPRDVQVLLQQRPDNDPHMRGRWGGTGTTLCGHESVESALARIVATKLGGAGMRGPHKIWAGRIETPRGPEMSELYSGFLEGAYTAMGKWYSIRHLPKTLLEHQRFRIQLAEQWLEQSYTNIFAFEALSS